MNCSHTEVVDKNTTDKDEHLKIVEAELCRRYTSVDSRYVFDLTNVTGILITGLLEVRTSGGSVPKCCRKEVCEKVDSLIDCLNSATSSVA